MRRRTKLLLSVATLSLTIAFLVLGVFAATAPRQALINGSVSFEIENVDATIAIKHKLPHRTSNNPSATLIDTITHSVNEENQSGRAIYLPSITFTDVNVRYVIEVTITNTFTTTRKIGLTPGANNTLQPSTHIGVTETITQNPAGSYFNGKLSANSTVTFTYTYLLDDQKSDNFTNQPISLSFSLLAV